jgi:hypothetical protein
LDQEKAMNIFQIDHVFITFAPGAGGNFIAGLLDKINSGTLSEIYVSKSGSSHVVNNGKVNGGDSISFGSNPEENTAFPTVADRETYYLDRITREYPTPTKIITWTHDFTNLPLYKKYFDASRSLVITTYDVNEKLISILMHVTKVILSDESDIPIPTELWAHLKARLKAYISAKLEYMLKAPVDIDHIFDNRLGVYNDLVFYLSTVALLNYSGLYDVLKLLEEYPDGPPRHRNFNIRELISQNADVILPYSYLINNDINLLQDTVSKVFNRRLSDNENNFIQTAFDTYRSKQDNEILTNPLSYFNSRKHNAFEIAKRIKTGTL